MKHLIYFILPLAILFSSCVTVDNSHPHAGNYSLQKNPSNSSSSVSEATNEISNTYKKLNKKLSRKIYSKGKATPQQLYSFFMNKCPTADKEQIKRLAQYYVVEAANEGINSDVAFVQMCLETNYLRFGNLVSPEMHNYCGLGSIDEAHRGEVFETEQLGVRAHIQHLHAYATKSNVALKNALVDKRYKYVNPRGKAKTVFELAGTWAADKQYGKKLDKLLSDLGK